MRYHLTSVRMATIEISTNNKFWRGCGEKGTLLTDSGNVNRYSYCGDQYEISFKKLNIELPYNPKIPLLGIYPEKILTQKDTCTHNVHCSTSYDIQDIEAI